MGTTYPNNPVFFLQSLKLAITFKDVFSTKGAPTVENASWISGQGQLFHKALEKCYVSPRAQTTFLVFKVLKTGLLFSPSVCFRLLL